MSKPRTTPPVDWPGPDARVYETQLQQASTDAVARAAQLIVGKRPLGGRATHQPLLLDAWRDPVAVDAAWERMSPPVRDALSYLAALGGRVSLPLLQALCFVKPERPGTEYEALVDALTMRDLSQTHQELVTLRAAGWLIGDDGYGSWASHSERLAIQDAGCWHPGMAARRIAPPLGQSETPSEVVAAWPMQMMPLLVFLVTSQIRQAGGWELQRNGMLRRPPQKAMRVLLQALVGSDATGLSAEALDDWVEFLVECARRMGMLTVTPPLRLVVDAEWHAILDTPQGEALWLQRWLSTCPPLHLRNLENTSTTYADAHIASYLYWMAVARQACADGPDWVEVFGLLPALDALLPLTSPYLSRGVRPISETDRQALVAFVFDPQHTTAPSIGWTERHAYGIPLEILRQLLPRFGLADAGVTAARGIALRTTPALRAVVRAGNPTDATLPVAWFASNGDLTVDLTTVPLGALAVLAQLVERISRQDNLVTMGISERSVQAALRGGLKQEAIDAAIGQLRVQSPSWLTAATQDHARRQSTYTVIRQVRVDVDKAGSAVVSSEPAPARPSPDPAMVATRGADGRLLYRKVARLEYFARVQRLGQRSASGWELTRRSVQAAIKAGIPTATARAWLHTHVQWPSEPDVWVDLLVVANALRAQTGKLVRLPKSCVDHGGLPPGLQAFDAYRLGNDIPFLLVPNEEIAAFEVALRAAGLGEG